MRTKQSIIAASILGAFSCAFAEEPKSEKPEPPRPPREQSDAERVAEFFERHDHNGDGVVDFEEFRKGRRIADLDEATQKEIFSRFDKNNDGKIEPDEIKDHRPPRGGGGFGDRFIEQLDTDKDGKVSFEEFRQSPRFKDESEERVREIFDRMDHNKDGFLSREDRRPEGEGPRRRPNLDTDGDGFISKEEFAAAPWNRDASEEEVSKRFAQIDKEGKGKVSIEEFRSHRGEGRRGGPEGRPGRPPRDEKEGDKPAPPADEAKPEAKPEAAAE